MTMRFETILPVLLSVCLTGGAIVIAALLARCLSKRAPRVLLYALLASVLLCACSPKAAKGETPDTGDMPQTAGEVSSAPSPVSENIQYPTLPDDRDEHTEVEYNEAGQKLKETSYNGDRVRYVIDYEYDDDGLLLKAVMDADGEITTTEQEYEDGICVRVVYRRNGEIIGSMELEHDADGSFTKKATLNPDGTVSSVMKIYYDYFNGEKLVSEQEWIYPESNRHTQRYEYDERGRKIRAKTFDADEKLLRTEEYEYSDSGEMLKATAYVDGEVRSLKEYVYNEAGELQNIYQYDGKGNLLHKQNDPGLERPAA